MIKLNSPYPRDHRIMLDAVETQIGNIEYGLLERDPSLPNLRYQLSSQISGALAARRYHRKVLAEMIGEENI